MNDINGPSSGVGPREIGDTGAAGSSRSQSTSAPATQSNSTSARTDQLSLTDQANQLKALEQQIAELPVVDTQRVEQIQQSIAAGNYEIQPARVAEKMLSFEAGLPDNPPPETSSE